MAGGADRLARCLADMPDKQAAALSTIYSLGQRKNIFERSLGTGLSLEACRPAGNSAQWAYEKMIELIREKMIELPGGVPG